MEQPIFEEVVAAQPDLYISLGDAIYGDFDGKATYDVTEASLRAEWGRLARRPAWAALVARVPVVATWDNHDYGHHSAGSEFPLKETSKSVFLDFFAEPRESERRKRAGIYAAYTYGPAGRRVQVILLDTRSFKSAPRLAERPPDAKGSIGKYAPSTALDATLLGSEQWAWLESVLRAPADLRIVASSGQVVADEKGMDEWGNYPAERRRLFQLIDVTDASGVLFLSGNVHFSEVSETQEGPYRMIDFTSSGLTHVNETYPQAPNRYRAAGPFVAWNFGLVEIDWDAAEGAHLTCAAIDLDGHRAFEFTVALASLSKGKPR